MASACINNGGIQSENLIDCSFSYPSSDRLSPRISFSCDNIDDGGRNIGEKPDLERYVKDFTDFEFRLDDSVKMFSADELISDGKLIPLKLAPIRQAKDLNADVRSHIPTKLWCMNEAMEPDLCSFSPKAPRCSSRWKDLLGRKKSHSSKSEHQNAATASSKGSNIKSLRSFLHRNTRHPLNDTSISLPLLRTSDPELRSTAGRASISSEANHEDISRLFPESEKVNSAPISPIINPPRCRVTNAKSLKIRQTRTSSAESSKAIRSPKSDMDGDPSELAPPRGSAMDSPRLNASGKVIFNGLERSSSSPSSFNGGPRTRLRGMQRSYSANVMVSPVLNVPLYTLRSSSKSNSAFDFTQLFITRTRRRRPH